MKPQRLVWGETLTELASGDERILMLDGDLATSTRADIFAEAHPDKFIEVGIAEQNMVGMAFGLSTLGYRPWLSTFGVFLTNRALDQIRMLVSQTRAPIRLAAAYSGLLNGASGKTHQDIEDFAVFRAMPNMTVLAPADAVEAEAVIRWAAEWDGPIYMRLARDAVADVFDHNYRFQPTLPVQLRDGNLGIVISTGVQTSRTAKAVEDLDQLGYPLRHIHLPMLKPVDSDAIAELIGDASLVITVEEHSKIGGLGDLVSEIVTCTALPVEVYRIGLEDSWAESGPNDFLLDKYGLSADRLVETIQSKLTTRATR